LKLLVIFAQREERYEGQYAPEVVAAVTEFENYDNPEYMEEQLKEAKKNPDFVAATLINIELGDEAADEIKAILTQPFTISGRVVK